jgi:hypothetical protein
MKNRIVTSETGRIDCRTVISPAPVTVWSSTVLSFRSVAIPAGGTMESFRRAGVSSIMRDKLCSTIWGTIISNSDMEAGRVAQIFDVGEKERKKGGTR